MKSLATIYAPNDDDPAFFESFFSHLQDFHCDDIILGGDFNLVLNLEMDKKVGLAKTHTEQLMQSTSTLQNSTWLMNGGYLTLTWRRRKPENHAHGHLGGL